jgi:hypothetical protein
VISAAQAGHRRSAFATPVEVSHTDGTPLQRENVLHMGLDACSLYLSVMRGKHHSITLQIHLITSNIYVAALYATLRQGFPKHPRNCVW